MRLLPERHADGGGRAAGDEARSRATPTSTRPSPTSAAAAPTSASARRSSAPRAGFAARRRVRRRQRGGDRVKRRGSLLSGLGAAGALVVGWGLLPPRSRLGGADTLPAVEKAPSALNGWIKIAADGAVVLAMHAQRDGPGRAHRAGDAGRRRTRRAAGARAPRCRPAPTRSTATSPCSSASLPFHPRDDEPARDSPRQGGQLGGRQARARAGHQRHRRLVAAWPTPGTCCAWRPPRRGRSCWARRRCAGSCRSPS